VLSDAAYGANVFRQHMSRGAKQKIMKCSVGVGSACRRNWAILVPISLGVQQCAEFLVETRAANLIAIAQRAAISFDDRG